VDGSVRAGKTNAKNDVAFRFSGLRGA